MAAASITPAASASSQGISPASMPSASTAASAAPKGSTRPLATPAPKARQRPPPARQMGKLTAAPSGRFCSPMPTLSASAPAAAAPVGPVLPAARPTTMP